MSRDGYLPPGVTQTMIDRELEQADRGDRDELEEIYIELQKAIATVKFQENLIADMLTALKEMVTWCPSGFAPQSQDRAYRMAYAAIAKAEGRHDR